MPLVLAFLIGVVAGLRAMTAPAAVSWAVTLRWIDVGPTWLAFLGARFTPYLLSLLAAVELVTDQLPTTPSRRAPPAFIARIASGALCGAAVGASGGAMVAGLALGALGAVVGTLGGASARARLAARFGGDRPAAFLEDAVAIAAAFLVVWLAR